MKREIGDKTFSIWLLGDSEPKRWKDKITLPFDDMHPIRHNIWTSIIDKIQEKIYRYNKSRIDTHRIYIRNAVDNPNKKPKANNYDWANLKGLNENLNEYKRIIKQYEPKVILSFGSFAFEFGRRSLDEKPNYSFNYWGAKNLGIEFRRRIIDTSKIKLIPLLHRSIAGGKFLESHEYFCDSKDANYFYYVAENIFQIVKDYKDIYIN